MRRLDMPPSIFFLGASLLILTALAADARAADEAPPSQPPPQSSYGWQTLAVDGVAVAVIGTGLALSGFESWTHTSFYSHLVFDPDSHGDAPRGALVATDVGVILYTVGAPIVHALHGRPTATGISALFRALLPSVAGFAGGAIGVLPSFIGGDCHLLPSETCTNDTARLNIAHGFFAGGIILGYVATSAIDALALAREAKPVAENAAGLSPRITLLPGAFGIGAAF